MVVVKGMIFSTVLVFTAGPGSVPVLANSVPMPPDVTSQVLDQPLRILPQEVSFASLSGIKGDEGAPVSEVGGTPELVAPGRQLRVVQVLGRPLALSLMRADRSGLAVLSVPKRSVIANLPDIAPQEFLDLVVAETGCQPVGQLQIVGSTRGTVALATGLACG